MSSKENPNQKSSPSGIKGTDPTPASTEEFTVILEEPSQPELSAKTAAPPTVDLSPVFGKSSPSPFADEKTDPGIVVPFPPKSATPLSSASPVQTRSTSPSPRPSPTPALSPSLSGPPRAAAAPEPSPPTLLAKMPGLGPLLSLWNDPEITEIMVNDLRPVLVEKSGKIRVTQIRAESNEELNRWIRAMTDITGRALTPENPFVDLILPDGSRAHIIGPPLTLGGPVITIRRFKLKGYSLEELIQAGCLDKRMAFLLKLAVQARLNLLIAGGTGTGKTTLLNTLLRYSAASDRIITLEEIPEIQTQHINSVRLLTRGATPTSGAVTIRDLLINSLRMRPDRIIVGECRGPEVMEMIQALNTGHQGCMTTVHANHTRDALIRLETLAALAQPEIPTALTREQLGQGFQLIIQMKRFSNGQRKIVSISEITGTMNGVVLMQPLFEFKSSHFDPHHLHEGSFQQTEVVPRFKETLEEMGIQFPAGFFALKQNE